MITSAAQYKRELAKMIRDEEKGQKEYGNIIKALPSTPEFDHVRKSLREIASDERSHETTLRRLYGQVS